MSDPDASRSALSLQRIADALGVPVETFLDPTAGGDEAETLELLRVWSAIADPQARRRVLNLARREAERLKPEDDA